MKEERDRADRARFYRVVKGSALYIRRQSYGYIHRKTTTAGNEHRERISCVLCLHVEQLLIPICVCHLYVSIYI